MDYYDMMRQYAPKDCQPGVLTEEKMLDWWAKGLGKTREELTEEEIHAAWENHDAVCWTEADLANS